jgi:hypothetical protein
MTCQGNLLLTFLLNSQVLPQALEIIDGRQAITFLVRSKIFKSLSHTGSLVAVEWVSLPVREHVFF